MYNYLIYNGTLHVEHLQCLVKSKCTQDKSHTVVKKKSYDIIIGHYSLCCLSTASSILLKNFTHTVETP